jgi:hypothetical protein
MGENVCPHLEAMRPLVDELGLGSRGSVGENQASDDLDPNAVVPEEVEQEDFEEVSEFIV